MLPELLSAMDAADAIFSKQDGGRATIRVEHRRRGGKLLKCAPRFLATGAIAYDACDGSADRFVFHAAASAPRLHDVHRPIRHRQLVPLPLTPPEYSLH